MQTYLLYLQNIEILCLKNNFMFTYILWPLYSIKKSIFGILLICMSIHILNFTLILNQLCILCIIKEPIYKSEKKTYNICVISLMTESGITLFTQVFKTVFYCYLIFSMLKYVLIYSIKFALCWIQVCETTRQYYAYP